MKLGYVDDRIMKREASSALDSSSDIYGLFLILRSLVVTSNRAGVGEIYDGLGRLMA